MPLTRASGAGQFPVSSPMGRQLPEVRNCNPLSIVINLILLGGERASPSYARSLRGHQPPGKPSDAHRLTSNYPITIMSTYKTDAHSPPLAGRAAVRRPGCSGYHDRSAP
jgi:hypothetical protein